MKSRDMSKSAIVESGSNANGEYVKWDDGTMICWIEDFSVTTTTDIAIGNIFAVDESIDFAETFIANPNVVMNVNQSSSTTWYGGMVTNGLASATVRLCGSNVTAKCTYGYTAIGRWK